VSNRSGSIDRYDEYYDWRIIIDEFDASSNERFGNERCKQVFVVSIVTRDPLLEVQLLFIRFVLRVAERQTAKVERANEGARLFPLSSLFFCFLLFPSTFLELQLHPNRTQTSTMASPRNENPFKKLVRSLSRSSPRTERPSNSRQRSTSGAINIPNSNKENGGISPSLAAFSTSPPPGELFPHLLSISFLSSVFRVWGEELKTPGNSANSLLDRYHTDSYFPAPPAHVLSDKEAAGIERHPESVGARAFDVGDDETGKSAPGVSFAPRANGEAAVRPDSELEGWAPPPRRTTSQRVPRRQPSSTSRGGLTRGRSNGNTVTTSTAEEEGQRGENEKETVTIGGRTIDAGERKGVSLSDTPLSRRTSVKRAASSFKKAVSKSFEPAPKQVGEKRVMVLVADGTEEIEVM